MGEAADMVVDGILNWDGDYLGEGYMPPRRRRKVKALNPEHALQGVRCYLRTFKRSNANSRSHKTIHRILDAYAQKIDFPVAGPNESHDEWDLKMAWKLQEDFGAFVKWCKAPNEFLT